MPLRQPWEPLERETLRSIPDRYGIYELADDEGTIIAIDHGPLRDAIKEAMSYDETAASVRYRVTPHREAAVALVEEHRGRLDD